MIEEVLQSVKQTEEQAARIVGDAEAAAQSLRQDTEQKVAADWEQTKSRAKQQRFDRMEAARSEADGKVAAIRRQSDADCQALWDKCEGRIDAIVDQLMERITNGDC